MTNILVERHGDVVTITLNRPEKLNSLDEPLLRELLGAIVNLEGDGAARAAVLTGAGEKAFAAGADIAAMSQMTPPQAKAFADLGHEIGARMEQSRMPFVAAVNGFALGGGCELALACDFVYASEKARLGQPEVNLGVIPGFGGTQRLARRVGSARARELCMTGDAVGAAEALRLGLVNAVVPAADLLPRAREVAKKIAGKGPLAIAALKRIILRGEGIPLAAANELEATAFSALFGTHDQREGMRAFLEKRPPAFKGE
ncbi:MAG TPA: enoyl-CoA hydratase-related protein [Polyangiaceae bacterium]|nr:enoyl-CoA hydratase-related protein [Polyangiaceae bacterium]